MTISPFLLTLAIWFALAWVAAAVLFLLVNIVRDFAARRLW